MGLVCLWLVLCGSDITDKRTGLVGIILLSAHRTQVLVEGGYFLDVDFVLVDLPSGFGAEGIEQIICSALLLGEVDRGDRVDDLLAAGPLFFVLRRLF